MTFNIYCLLSGCIFIGSNVATSFIEESIQIGNPYPEVPCDLLPATSWRDQDRNLWGIRKNDILWFNYTEQTWNTQPLPNTTSSILKVSCVIQGCHSVLEAGDTIFIHHAIHKKWLEIADVPTKSTVICHQGIILVIDLDLGIIYQINPSSGQREKTSQLPDSFHHTNNQSKLTSVIWWADEYDNIYILSDSSIWKGNLTDWRQLDQHISDQWPVLYSQTVGWRDGEQLWIWTYGKGHDNVWTFDMTLRHWNSVEVSNQENTTIPIATWIEETRLCALIPRGACNTSYVSTEILCLHHKQENNHSTIERNLTEVLQQTTTVSDVTEFHPLLHASWHPKFFPTSDSTDVDHTMNKKASAAWHPEHSSVFGSVVFFGTSLTIFGIVGIVWCIRRCVHFPKEALLLRDPPSVRYTAIPDTVA